MKPAVDWEQMAYEAQKAIPVWGPCVMAGECWYNGDYLGYFLWGGVGLVEAISLGQAQKLTRTAMAGRGMLRVSSLKFSEHALERMAERQISQELVEKAVTEGTKYLNKKHGTINFVIEKAFPNGKHLVVGLNPETNTVTTVMKARDYNFMNDLIRME